MLKCRSKPLSKAFLTHGSIGDLGSLATQVMTVLSWDLDQAMRRET